MFGSRLKEERLKIQLSQEDLAERLGVKKNTVWNWENEKSYPNALQIMDFLDFGLDVQYILTGKHRNPKAVSDTEDFAYIPIFDVAVSAGNGAVSYGVTSPVTCQAFRKDWIRSRGLTAENLQVLTAEGDSMEPTIGNGSTLVVDSSKNEPKDGRIYVIRVEDNLWVKRVQKQLDGTLLLISDNDAYPPMSLNLADHHDVAIIGQVVNVSKDLN